MTLSLELDQLSDQEILHIFRQVYHSAQQPNFLQSFAAALLLCDQRDFALLRGVAVILIAKYSLGCYLASYEPALAFCEACSEELQSEDVLAIHLAAGHRLRKSNAAELAGGGLRERQG